jgi:signal transduction histidine kinase
VRLEEMMIQSEKMLSVGGLAAGMAHEINNPLAGMMQTAEVMANRLKGNINIPANRKAAEAAGTTIETIEGFMEARGIPRMLDVITDSGKRIATIVNNMLSFARKSEATFSFHILEDLLDKTAELAATDYDLKKQYDFKKIDIRREYAGNLPQVPCDGAKIQQVLLNILRNGAQAMQAAGIESPCFIFRTRFNPDKDMVIIEIEDNGPGMDDETRKRVFEPFFTTKPVGVGTGLGLSVSYFIITENHGGEMAVEASSGTGAKFIIRLPVKGK